MHKVAVVGSRNYPHPEIVRKYVKEWVGIYNPYNDIVQIVSGHGGIVDLTAEEVATYAWKHQYNTLPMIFPAEWRKEGHYNPRAGFERNTLIVDYCDEVCAFWFGNSRGTKDTIKKAVAAGKPVTVFDENGDIVPAADWQELL